MTINVKLKLVDKDGKKEEISVPYSLVETAGVIQHNGKHYNFVSGRSLFDHKFVETEIVNLDILL